jgi:uncharacterized protein (TIGR03000 family)
MRLTVFKAILCASLVALSASPAKAGWWPGYGYGGYWPAYSYYWGGYYGYYPGYWGNYYSYSPYYYSYYPTYSYYTYPDYYAYYTPSYYTYPTYAASPVYYSADAVVAAPTTSSYRSFYPPETIAAGPALNEAEIRVRTAPDAAIAFDGHPTVQTGSFRTFSTPDLRPGKSYSYEVKVRWIQNGSPVERTRTVAVAAGETVDVDLTPSNLMR